MEQLNFNELLIENTAALLPFSFSLTQDYHDAEDLIQDTLFRALIYQEKYKADSNIQAWLFTIMRNIFINNYRKRKRFVKVSQEIPPDYFLFQNNQVVNNEGLMLTGLTEIKNAMSKLPKVFKLSFEMHYSGYKYQEIADILKEPLGTIKSRIHFARKMLAKSLSN